MEYRHNFSHVLGVELPIAVAVFAAVLLVLVVTVVRRRAGAGVTPSKKSKHPRLEAAYAVAVLGMAIFLIVNGDTANSADFRTSGAPSLVVRITGYQWCWRADYPSAGVTVTGDCRTGNYPTVVLPTDRPIDVELTSNDVVHELWIPFLRFKMEAFPDHWNSFPLQLGQTGTFQGKCSEFCGLYHDTMFVRFRVLAPAAFDRWLAAHSEARIPGAQP